MWRVLSAGFSLYADPGLSWHPHIGERRACAGCTNGCTKNIWSLWGCWVTRG